MKESVLDVLMYLFEHCFEEDADVDSDQESLKEDLIQAGFPESQVSKAFLWLEALATRFDTLAPDGDGGRASTRVYTHEEMERLDLACRGFLVFLEQVGVLDPVSRELVVDRVMALGADEFDVEQLKWVVLMVLFNQPGREPMLQWMEDVVFEKTYTQLH